MTAPATPEPAVERRGIWRFAAYHDALVGLEVQAATRKDASDELEHLTRFVEGRTA